MAQPGAISDPATSVPDHPPALPLPLPRYLLKRGELVDRWTGSRYRTAPSVLVGLLNHVHGDVAQAVQRHLDAGLKAQAARQAAEIDKLRTELRDVYALVKREREACHGLAAKLHTLQAAVDEAWSAHQRGRAGAVRDVLEPLATPENPFALTDRELEDRVQP